MKMVLDNKLEDQKYKYKEKGGGTLFQKNQQISPSFSIHPESKNIHN